MVARLSKSDNPIELYNMPGHLIRRLQQIAVSIYLNETRSSGVRPVQFATLSAIRAFPGLDQMELSRGIALDRSTIQDVIIRLEKRGLVRRDTDPGDRRRRVLYITETGAQTLDDMAEDNRRAQAKILEPLSPEERKTFLRLITRLVNVNNRFSRAPLVDRKINRNAPCHSGLTSPASGHRPPPTSRIAPVT